MGHEGPIAWWCCDCRSGPMLAVINDACACCSHLRCSSCKIETTEPTRGSTSYIAPPSTSLQSTISSGSIEPDRVEAPPDPRLSRVNDEAGTRARDILDRAANQTQQPSLAEVVQDRIWPFYSNWLHKPLGACTRVAKFDENGEGKTTVKICIICKQLPDRTFQKIVKDRTLDLVPDHFKSNNQVVIEFSKGTSTLSANRVENQNEYHVELGMGCEIRSYHQAGYCSGSMGPWFEDSCGRTLVYTNEHVVRSGLNQGNKSVTTYDEGSSRGRPLGNVTLTSRAKADGTMECNNPEVSKSVREGNSFHADWATIECNKSDAKLMCPHIKKITHIPLEGIAMAFGAASQKHRNEPWKGALGRIEGRGTPTTISAETWGNSIDLACWSLSRLKSKDGGYSADEWNKFGIGIPGDSGAGVIDCQTGNLCGLVIGQIDEERIALIIDMMDVFIDTAKVAGEDETMKEMDFGKVELPQCNIDCHLLGWINNTFPSGYS